ncbi:MAG: proton-conducting transporter membrane subunit [Anaerolineales bacterium]
MTLPGPIPIVVIPLAMAVILQLLRRWTTLVAWLGATAATLVGLGVILLPLDEIWRLDRFNIVGVDLGEPLVLLGRQLVVQPGDRLALAFLFFTTAGLFVIAWRLLPHSNFFPIALATVSLLAAALMVQQVVYAALLVEMAAILTVFPLHEPLYAPLTGGAHRRQSASGGLQYMAYVTLALPGLMVTQLLLDLFAIRPNDLGLLRTSATLLSLSFAILFGAVPFQSWLSNVATDGSPPVVTFVFTVNLGAVWFLLLDYLQSYIWLEQQTPFGPLFTALGLLMMVTGGLLAASQRRLGRLVGYATLVDNGAMLLALSTERTEGIALAALMLIARPLSLGLMTLGLQGLRDFGNGSDHHEAVRGAAWHSPWRAAAFWVGGIALAGFPISLNFAARWGLYRLVAADKFFVALLALGGSAGVMFGLVNAFRTLLVPVVEGNALKITIAEDRVVLILIIALIATVLALGFFPQGASRLALQMAEWYTFFE